MSKQANKTMIGVFVLGAIGLAFVAVLLLGSGKFFAKTFIAVCYFEGSVGGLNTGAPVVFRGVKVGSVKDVVLRYDAKNLIIQIPVYIELDPRQGELIGRRPKKLGENLRPLIERGLRAQLQLQSFVTGQMQVALDFYPGKPANLFGADEKYPEIPTIPSAVQELSKRVEQIPIDEILKKVQSTLEGMERVINSPEIDHTLQSVSRAAGGTEGLVKNLNTQMTPLASNANDTVKDLQKLVRNLDQQTSTVMSNIGETLKDVRSLVQNLNGRVEPLASGFEATMKEIQTLTKEVHSLVRNVDAKIDQLGPSSQKTLDAAGLTLQQAQATFRAVGVTAGEDSPLIYQAMQTLKELAAVARSLRTLADYVERHPEAVIQGKK
jgi:paraquat-inducible protein B